MGEAVGEFEAVVGLHTLDPHASALEPFDRTAQEIGGGIGALLGVSSQASDPAALVDGGVLKQPQFRIRDTGARHHFHIDLHAMSRIEHLLVGL